MSFMLFVAFNICFLFSFFILMILLVCVCVCLFMDLNWFLLSSLGSLCFFASKALAVCQSLFVFAFSHQKVPLGFQKPMCFKRL